MSETNDQTPLKSGADSTDQRLKIWLKSISTDREDGEQALDVELALDIERVLEKWRSQQEHKSRALPRRLKALTKEIDWLRNQVGTSTSGRFDGSPKYVEAGILARLDGLQAILASLEDKLEPDASKHRPSGVEDEVRVTNRAVRSSLWISGIALGVMVPAVIILIALLLSRVLTGQG